MDGVFNLPEATRSDFLRSLMHTFGCTYICLWHCHSSSNNLLFLDGIYNNVSSTVAEETLFNLYQRLTFDAANDEWVPGAAFRRHMAYLELQQLDLLRLASAVIQTQFYLEARIETAIFMGCSKGEIELGFSTIPQIDMKAAVKSLFPEDFSREQIHHPASSSSCSCPSDEFSSLGGVLLPAPEGEQEAIIRAILHVISSSSSPATTTSQPPPYNNSAFRAYPSTTYNLVTSSSRRFSLMKRSIEFSRTLHLMRIRDRFHFQRQHQPPHPLIIGTQNANNNKHLHHIILERRRRENENKCFRELRALLPPGTKKHKSSVLIAAKEALKSLIAEIEKLNIRNQQLKTLLGSSSSSYGNVHISSSPSSSNERLNVAVSHNLSFVSMAANTTTNTQGTTITQIIFRIRILQGSEWDESGFVEAVRRVVSNLP
ncbi:putative transcription factor bHLH041 [Arachis duranensis]|uniref:Transcription factor bHLH041 n=1 Tax=Arachis duranensis TaxID=130453 RepID=A0A9C6T5C2_ARADU|nr:putative transcription factor bHLH041 [Arachis duranensis]